jgi:hypothetical protein
MKKLSKVSKYLMIFNLFYIQSTVIVRIIQITINAIEIIIHCRNRNKPICCESYVTFNSNESKIKPHSKMYKGYFKDNFMLYALNTKMIKSKC